MNKSGVEESKSGLVWREKNLKLLNITFDFLDYEKGVHVIKDDYNDWVLKQKEYFNNFNNEYTKEAIELITMKSMKLFNYIIDSNSVKSLMSDDVKKLINKFGNEKIQLLNNNIIKYSLNSPLSENDIVIYSGIDRLFYEKIKDYDDFITNRYMSGTFNKEHANYYSFVGSRGKYSRNNKLPYTVYNITIPKKFNKIFYFEYENQIVFLPGIKFKKQKNNFINNENIMEISGKRLKKENVSIENVYYTIDETHVPDYEKTIDTIEILQNEQPILSVEEDEEDEGR